MACRSPGHDFSDGWGFFSHSLANPPIGKKPIKGWAQLACPFWKWV